MRFRPCIDLHDGKVKQIVGATLRDGAEHRPVTNYEAVESPAYFARIYRRDGLQGGHVIKLGPGNDAAAMEALAAYPGGLQVGGGMTADNAAVWLERGAQKVIVTSYVFRDGRLCRDRLEKLRAAVGRDKLVLDMSCRKRGGVYYVATERWQTFTDVELSAEALQTLAEFCSEYLVHAVDIEGRQQGIDRDLIRILAEVTPLPTTYAGGVRNVQDLEAIEELGNGCIDATAGSSLDIFGGSGLKYADAVAFDRARR